MTTSSPTDPGPTRRRAIALAAHDRHKPALCAWAARHRDILRAYALCATGTTARVVADATCLAIAPLASGPLGGDQQIGARIVQGDIDALVFFWDPLAAHAHAADIQALMRVAVIHDVPMANNPASADILIASPQFADASRTAYPYLQSCAH